MLNICKKKNVFYFVMDDLCAFRNLMKSFICGWFALIESCKLYVNVVK